MQSDSGIIFIICICASCVGLRLLRGIILGIIGTSIMLA